jgi:hypothetical protein
MKPKPEPEVVRSSKIALIRTIREQLELQDYRREHDKRINLELSFGQADLLFDIVNKSVGPK